MPTASSKFQNESTDWYKILNRHRRSDWKDKRLETRKKIDRTVNSVIDSTLHHVVLPLFQIAVRRAQKKVQLTQQE